MFAFFSVLLVPFVTEIKVRIYTKNNRILQNRITKTVKNKKKIEVKSDKQEYENNNVTCKCKYTEEKKKYAY